MDIDLIHDAGANAVDTGMRVCRGEAPAARRVAVTSGTEVAYGGS
jgi:hypothetical protein